MADWYVSSAAYALIAAFTTGSYTLGQIVKPSAPALKAQWVFRCTTAGSATVEPTWPTGNNATVTATGGAVFTNVTGQSAFFWSACAGDMPTLFGAAGINRFAPGDTIYVSSDHAETQTGATNYGATTTNSYAQGRILSVNRAGSTPPVAADLLAGASCTVSSGSNIINSVFPCEHYGITYVAGTGVGMFFGSVAGKLIKLSNCTISMTSNTSISPNAATTTVLNNCTINLSNAANVFKSIGAWEIEFNGCVFTGVNITNLFGVNNTSPNLITLRGTDLSIFTSTNLVAGSSAFCKYLFDSCKIAATVARYFSNLAGNANTDVVEYINCFDGTNIINERYNEQGSLVTERTITLTGGATDDVGTFSHKLVSNANASLVVPFESFWMDVPNSTVGGSRTATVEIISSASLNNNDIWLVVEYQGTLGSSLASFVTSFPATVLTAAAAVPTSTASWNSSPATPVTQKLQVTFTPQTVGRVRGQVRLGKVSTTVYVDPRLVLT